MRTALVIGASRGIGREIVNQLLADKWKVYATARDSNALTALKAEGAHPLRLDVARAHSLAELPWQLDGERLDLVVYAASTFGPDHGAGEPPQEVDFDAVMHANVLGAMQCVPLLAPLVEAAGGKFVFLSSAMGSIADTRSSVGWLFRVSKAALHMAVRAASYDYPGSILVAMNPGWVQSDRAGPQAPTPLKHSVAGMLKVIEGLKPEDSGTVQGYDGRKLNW